MFEDLNLEVMNSITASRTRLLSGPTMHSTWMRTGIPTESDRGNRRRQRKEKESSDNPNKPQDLNGRNFIASASPCARVDTRGVEANKSG